jgi:hypothetical protein
MNSSLKSFFFLFTLAISANAQSLPKTFQQLLNKTNMQYSIPPDFTPTPVVDNGDVVYDFAIKSNSTGLEIRYRIWPIDKTLKNPNAVFEAMLVTMAMNISNGKMIHPQRFPQESVKLEFGADAGSTGLVPTNSEFGKGFKGCMLSVIHKDNVADAYIFYLYNTQDEIMGALSTDNIFHALKFK